MGTLRRQAGGGGDVLSFEYDQAWLKRREAFAFDPDLALIRGAQYPAGDRPNFGIFLDSSPDRWGRTLMQRRENARARAENRRRALLQSGIFCWGCTTKHGLARCAFALLSMSRSSIAIINSLPLP
ncbi:MAG: hypothetical protein HC872_02515 [Gammaproteobacteria bacterium]|nr:hypothetical protein [Gammaproteobacteria bacterium]